MTSEGVMTTKLTECGVPASIASEHHLKVGSIVRFKGTDDRYEVSGFEDDGDAVLQVIDTIEVDC